MCVPGRKGVTAASGPAKPHAGVVQKALVRPISNASLGNGLRCMPSIRKPKGAGRSVHCCDSFFLALVGTYSVPMKEIVGGNCVLYSPSETLSGEDSYQMFYSVAVS